MSRVLMEGVVALVVEWISLEEMFKLQELSPSVSGTLKGWEGKEIMESLVDQIWSDMNEEWAEHVHGEGNSQAF